MDEGHESERIEIELTSHDPAGAAARARRMRSVPVGGEGDATDPGETGVPVEPGFLGTERGRLVTVGAVAAMIALLVGVLLGRIGSGEVESSGGDGAVTTDEVTTDEATTTTRPASTGDTLPRAPTVLAPTTTRPVRTTTTTIGVDDLVAGSVAINPGVAREKIEIVAMTGSGVLVRIDAITGATHSTGTGAGFGQPFVTVSADGVIVPDDRGGFVFIADDGSRTSVDLGGWWPPLTSTSTVWRAEIDQGTGQVTGLVEVSFDGIETGAVIDVDGYYPQAIDPLGGVIVQAPGGFYAVRPDARERVTDGMLLALGERTAVVHECDVRLDCGYFVVDRASGTRERLALDPDSVERIEFGGFGWWSLGAPLSPDEDALVVVTFGDRGPAMGVLDLTTGSYVELGRFENEPHAAWGPGGRHLYWLEAGRIMVFDRSTGESVPFSDDLDRVVALDIRPFVAR
ncbi:MAG: hypothetical protein R8G01_08430 [Ilumatobacteraceae bacterium]|nr:hypothetical protein [Ilumatobacteraceae bacterium]